MDLVLEGEWDLCPDGVVECLLDLDEFMGEVGTDLRPCLVERRRSERVDTVDEFPEHVVKSVELFLSRCEVKRLRLDRLVETTDEAAVEHLLVDLHRERRVLPEFRHRTFGVRFHTVHLLLVRRFRGVA